MTDDRLINCPACQGTGDFSDGSKICPKCDGTGLIDALAEIDRLRTALKYYTDPGDYKLPFTGVLYFDCGDVAREALMVDVTPPKTAIKRQIHKERGKLMTCKHKFDRIVGIGLNPRAFICAECGLSEGMFQYQTAQKGLSDQKQVIERLQKIETAARGYVNGHVTLKELAIAIVSKGKSNG